MIEKVKHKEESKWLKLREEAIDLIAELQKKQSLSKPELADLKNKLNQSIGGDKSVYFDESLNVGDEVFITSYQQYGKIIDIKEDTYTVKFGKFELSFDKSDLKKDKPKPSDKPKLVQKQKSEEIKPQKEGKLEVDLRGFRYEEVQAALDDAIDGALMSGLTTLRIIHGFGTGAVRKAVHSYIKSSPYIKEHRYGGEGEGLNGVTIVTLK